MIRIIPAIDIIDGKCVRLTTGDYSQKKVYHSDPVAVAQSFEDAGIRYLHLVDLDGARAKKIMNRQVLYDIARQTTLKIDFGGGIQSNQDIRIAFENGAHQITAGSIAVKNESMVLNWMKEFGTEKIIIGADSTNEKIAVSGWTENTGIDVFSYLQRYIERGACYAICTDISRDGMLQGTNIDFYRRIKEQFPQLFLIASGGVTGIEEIVKLEQSDVEGVIIGKALYEGKINLSQLERFLC